MREVDMAFLIADLSGYTALTEAHGDSHAASVVARYGELARSVLVGDARVVEQVGDQLLIGAPQARTALRTASSLRDAVEREPLFPQLRSGLHAGRVLAAGDRYVGGALNLTARVAAHAQPGQILCTEPLAHGVGPMEGITFRPLGRVRFKNLADPVGLLEVARPSEPATVAVDPVCRMQVRPEDAPARLPWDGVTYHFCSFPCARAFAERPGTYVGTDP